MILRHCQASLTGSIVSSKTVVPIVWSLHERPYKDILLYLAQSVFSFSLTLIFEEAKRRTYLVVLENQISFYT